MLIKITPQTGQDALLLVVFEEALYVTRREQVVDEHKPFLIHDVRIGDEERYRRVLDTCGI